MIKLLNILKEIKEGAKVTFNNENIPTEIEISQHRLDGEQLQTVNDKTLKNSFNVYYSLESAPKTINAKLSQDALKIQFRTN